MAMFNGYVENCQRVSFQTWLFFVSRYARGVLEELDHDPEAQACSEVSFEFPSLKSPHMGKWEVPSGYLTWPWKMAHL